MAELHVWTDGVRREKGTPAAPVAAVPEPATGWFELQRSLGNQAVCRLVEASRSQHMTVQREVVADKLNVVGETHPALDVEEARRKAEKKVLAKDPYSFDADQYWTEETFTYGKDGALGDSPALRTLQQAVILYQGLDSPKDKIGEARKDTDAFGELQPELESVARAADELKAEKERVTPPHVLIDGANAALEEVDKFTGFAVSVAAEVKIYEEHKELADSALNNPAKMTANDRRVALLKAVEKSITAAQRHLRDALLISGYKIEDGEKALDKKLTKDRSDHMHEAAEQAATDEKKGVWKVGDKHVRHLVKRPGAKAYTLTSEDEFNNKFFPED